MSLVVKFYFTYSMLNMFRTSIIRSLRLFYCITTLVVCSCFDVCWSFGVACLGWYPCGRLKQAEACHTDTTCSVKSSRSEAHLENNLKESVVTLKKITLHLNLRRPVYLWK